DACMCLCVKASNQTLSFSLPTGPESSLRIHHFLALIECNTSVSPLIVCGFYYLLLLITTYYCNVCLVCLAASQMYTPLVMTQEILLGFVHDSSRKD
ncbi:24238_t:CDS:2, partial [Racocetra persica]